MGTSTVLAFGNMQNTYMHRFIGGGAPAKTSFEQGSPLPPHKEPPLIGCSTVTVVGQPCVETTNRIQFNNIMMLICKQLFE